MSSVLQLNASYEPLRVIGIKDAIRLIHKGKADILESADAQVLRSEKGEIPRPVVIRLRKHVWVPHRFRKKVINQFLFARDNYTCQYCNRSEDELGKRERLNRDHVIPKAQGGQDVWTNVTTSCDTCNTFKADRTPKQAGMKLLSTPTEPHAVYLKWRVRKLTETQEKYITMFYGAEWASGVAGMVK